mgnify:CR=1 FL=1
MIESVGDTYCITVKAREIEGMKFPEIFRYWMGGCVVQVLRYDVIQTVYDPVADEFSIKAEVYWVGETDLEEPSEIRRNEE